MRQNLQNPRSRLRAFASIDVIVALATLLTTGHDAAHCGTSNSTEYFAAPVTFNRPSTRFLAGPMMSVFAIAQPIDAVVISARTIVRFASSILNELCL